MISVVPPPLPNERPTVYADRLGAWYLTWSKPNKDLGQFFTPLPVADYMAQVIADRAPIVRVLDPGAGAGILACAVCEHLKGDLDLEAYEVDPDLAACLEASLAYARNWMQQQGRILRYQIVQRDFVIARAWALQWPPSDPFDVVITNPPYFKLAKSDPRARAAASIVYGQPNIYAIFMALGAALLKPGGQGVFITPRSYAAGPYFSSFRSYFFAKMRPRLIHLFESRREVFSDVLQEAVILYAERTTRSCEVVVATSANSQDLSGAPTRTLPLSEVLNGDNVLQVPLSDHHDEIADIVRAWTGRLSDYGMAVSTGPVVPFRAVQWVSSTGAVPTTHVPLLWMQNIRPMHIQWPLPRKNQYMAWDGAERLLLPNRNMVLIRRFSAKEEKRRIVAAPYLTEFAAPLIGVENHLNYIHRPHGSLLSVEARGLATLLNSELLDTFFRISSGNTQVSATELRVLPLPPLTTIVEIGQRMATETDIDAVVNEALGIYA